MDLRSLEIGSRFGVFVTPPYRVVIGRKNWLSQSAIGESEGRAKKSIIYLCSDDDHALNNVVRNHVQFCLARVLKFPVVKLPSPDFFLNTPKRKFFWLKTSTIAENNRWVRCDCEYI